MYGALELEEAVVSARRTEMTKATKNATTNRRTNHLPRVKRAAKILRPITSRAAALRASPRALGIGAAVVVTGVATGATIALRRPLAKLVRVGVEEVTSVGKAIGKSTRRAAKTIGKGVDIQGILERAGLRRRSLFSRMMPELGILAGFLAATGSAVLLMSSRRLLPKSVRAATPGDAGVGIGTEDDEREVSASSGEPNSISSEVIPHAHS
jgi:hypothetical protein